MPTVVGAGDEFWAAWVCGGVGAVGETVEVFGADALWGMGEQSVWCFFGETFREWVGAGGGDSEDVGLYPVGCSGPCSRTRAGAPVDSSADRRLRTRARARSRSERNEKARRR